MLKKILILLISSVVLISMTGCNEPKEVLDNITSAVKAQGREYNNSYNAKIGESMDTAFFEWTITDVSKASEYEGLTASEGYILLIADCKAVNITDKVKYVEDDNELPMGNADFIVAWGDGDDDWDYAYDEFTDGMYPDEQELAIGETMGGILVFEIPADVADVSIIYEDYYTDDFVGDAYYYDIVLSEL